MKQIALALVALLALAGCREGGEGDYVRLAGHVFIFNIRIAEANYVISLQRLRELPPGAEIIAEFENPADGSKLISRRKVYPGTSNIAVESDPVYCIVEGKPYQYKIELIHDGLVLQTIEGSLKSTLSGDALPVKPLVVGPGYEPNPVNPEDAEGIYKLLKNNRCKT